MNKDIKQAIDVLNSGGIVIFPTDTVFGIGCRIDKLNAIERLFKIRKRPLSQPMPVLVDGLDMAKEYANIPKEVIEKLIKPFWPGALTIIVSCKKGKINKLITGGGDTIGIRMPNSSKVLGIINNIKTPITGSSANFHGESTPLKVSDLNPKLVDLVDFVLSGTCTQDLASTIIDTTKAPWKILRKGAIDIKIDL